MRDKTEKKTENLIKKTCKELGLTYRELGEKIGYSESAIKSAIAKNEISEPMKKSLQMQIEIQQLRDKLQEFESFKTFIKNMID